MGDATIDEQIQKLLEQVDITKEELLAAINKILEYDKLKKLENIANKLLKGAETFERQTRRVRKKMDGRNYTLLLCCALSIVLIATLVYCVCTIFTSLDHTTVHSGLTELISVR